MLEKLMEQLSWLTAPTPSLSAPTPIDGLTLIPDFISVAEEARLLELIDAAPWSEELRRRVQHYGYRYDYRKRDLSREDYVGELPRWAQVLADRLVQYGIFDTAADQVIVNEYLPGQGIAPHIDRETCFGEVVASLSLASHTTMDFTRRPLHVEVPLPPRSVVALRGDARHLWRHGITPRRVDRLGELALERKRRVSLTFRTTLQPTNAPEKRASTGRPNEIGEP